MHIEKALSFKTDPKVLEAMQVASRKKLSADQVSEQRVSFVYGVMNINDDVVTKDRVRQVILEQQGETVQK